jgi:iron complex outermembrane receptor protein
MTNGITTASKTILLLCFILFSKCIDAQTSFEITGQVKDSTAQPLSDAIIQVLRASDSTFIKSDFPNADGQFRISLTQSGEFYLVIQLVGYKTFESAPETINETKPVWQVGNITLLSNGQQLQTVQVVSKIPFAEKKIDRVTVNPDAMISNAGATALEVLEKAPGVQVDLNGNISLNGRQGVVIYIDDKPVYLGSSELASYLRSLPASSIAFIDIMTTPPAKYDAAGNVGIINIRIKKSKAEGLNGGFNVSYGQGFYHRTNNSINLNYRINKVNIFTNLSYNENNSYHDLTIERNYFNEAQELQTAFKQNTLIKNENKSATGRFGIDYYPNEKHTIGLLTSGFFERSDTYTTNVATIKNAEDALMTTVVALSPTRRDFVNGSGNLNYTWTLDSLNSQLSVNLDYSEYHSAMDQALLSKNYDPSDSLLSRTNLISKLPSDIQIATAKVDYSKPFRDGSRFDFGGKSSYIKTNNIAEFYDENDGILTINEDFSNQFEYEEKIQAGYINYNKEFKKISLQAGLRYEHTDIIGNQHGNSLHRDSVFTRTYDNIFPTFYAMYKIDTAANHILSFNYGRRIDRPNYQDMNPFTYPLDRFTLYAGNPFLQPTFSYNYELSYTLLNRYTATLYYSDVKNMISETIEQNTNIFYSRPGNIGKQQSYGIALSGAAELAKWWTLQFYTAVNYMDYSAKIYGQELNNTGTYWYIGPTNQFKFNDKFSAELGGSYQTRIVSAQFLLIPVATVRAALALNCMNNKGSLKLVLNDVFYTYQPGGDIRNLYQSTANWYSFFDSRVVTVAFGYRFNKGQVRSLRNVEGAEMEKSRVK